MPSQKYLLAGLDLSVLKTDGKPTLSSLHFLLPLGDLEFGDAEGTLTRH